MKTLMVLFFLLAIDSAAIAAKDISDNASAGRNSVVFLKHDQGNHRLFNSPRSKGAVSLGDLVRATESINKPAAKFAGDVATVSLRPFQAQTDSTTAAALAAQEAVWGRRFVVMFGIFSVLMMMAFVSS
ncbi:MAG: hypothetical protein NTV81_04350 [Candidatus Komeilibacteria bacterium]|nr:hypothetical protein [Candidatus Komeilibacteria bacterium]